MTFVPSARIPASRGSSGFSRTDMAAIAAVLALLAVAFLPAVARENEASEKLNCLHNVSCLVAAVGMYATDNEDHLPHPSWGSVGSSPGPDNWCYATRLSDGTAIPGAAGRSGPFAHTNQLPYFEASLLAAFLSSQRLLVCPTDWRLAMASSSSASSWYRQRGLKLTSYAMNGAVCGYGGRTIANAAGGATFKLSAFTPDDLLLWEADERSIFEFQDAGANPIDRLEGVSWRHTEREGVATTFSPTGDAIAGRFGSTAGFIPWRTFQDLRSAGGIGRPNELLCGPGYE